MTSRHSIFLSSLLSGALLAASLLCASPTASIAAEGFYRQDWATDPVDWYVEWKRVRKYARIGFEIGDSARLPGLRDQAAQLYDAWSRWPAPIKASCRDAAEYLKIATEDFVAARGKGLALLENAEPYGDACLAAGQKLKYGR